MKGRTCRIGWSLLGSGIFFLFCLIPHAEAQEADLDESLKVLSQADFGPDHQLVQQKAWGQLATANADQIPVILAFMKDATPLGLNWLRTAVDAIAERQLKKTGKLPEDSLERFVLDMTQPPLGRRVAFEWLERVDADARGRLIPKMLQDSSLDLRFEAIAQLSEQAEQETDAAKQLEMYRKAFTHARNVQQIESLAQAITGLGSQADLIRQMGYVIDWQIVGPFDNTDLAGFATQYGPETTETANDSFQGKDKRVQWQPYRSKSDFGLVDLNEFLENEKEVIAYARAIVTSPAASRVELRLASKNALKVWLNGKQVGEFEIYHSGFAIDQYVIPVELNAGKNSILVKVCQNAKKMGWEKEWEFRLRITDELGGAADVQAERFVETK